MLPRIVLSHFVSFSPFVRVQLQFWMGFPVEEKGGGGGRTGGVAKGQRLEQAAAAQLKSIQEALKNGSLRTMPEWTGITTVCRHTTRYTHLETMTHIVMSVQPRDSGDSGDSELIADCAELVTDLREFAAAYFGDGLQRQRPEGECVPLPFFFFDWTLFFCKILFFFF